MTALSRLTFSGRQATRLVVDVQDVRAAFLRLAKQRWDRVPPVEVLGFARGVVRLRTSSAAWRAELLWMIEDLHVDLVALLPPGVSIRRIQVSLG